MLIAVFRPDFEAADMLTIGSLLAFLSGSPVQALARLGPGVLRVLIWHLHAGFRGSLGLVGYRPLEVKLPRQHFHAIVVGARRHRTLRGRGGRLDVIRTGGGWERVGRHNRLCFGISGKLGGSRDCGGLRIAHSFLNAARRDFRPLDRGRGAVSLFAGGSPDRRTVLRELRGRCGIRGGLRPL